MIANQRFLTSIDKTERLSYATETKVWINLSNKVLELSGLDD